MLLISRGLEGEARVGKGHQQLYQYYITSPTDNASGIVFFLSPPALTRKYFGLLYSPDGSLQ